MTNAELIACIQAEEQGKKIECRRKWENLWRSDNHTPGQWNTEQCEYRIAREPRKCWIYWSDEGFPHVAVCESTDKKEEWEKNGWQLVEEVLR